MRHIKSIAMTAVLALAAAPALAAGPMDCSKGPVWNGAAQGFINGVAYKVDNVTTAPITETQGVRQSFDVYHLYLNSKAGQTLGINTVLVKGAKPDGTTMTSGLHGDGSDAAPGIRSIESWSLEDKPNKLKLMYFSANDATLQIVYGKRAHGAIPTMIHFCVPSKRTEIAGTFNLPL